MANLRLHGTINATIVGADNIHDRSRHTGIVPSFLGNVRQLDVLLVFSFYTKVSFAIVSLIKEPSR